MYFIIFTLNICSLHNDKFFLFYTKPTLMKDLVQENWLYSETCLNNKAKIKFVLFANIPSPYQLIKLFTKLAQI